ncbi:MAG: DUF5063 domain-containing protein [Breznakibacter sp.]
MQEPFVHLVYSRNVIEFVTVGREFCQFLEHTGEYEKRKFIDVSLKMLPLLYLKAVSLPKAELELDDATDRFVTEMDYMAIKIAIESKLGPHNDYLEVFTPDIDRSETAVAANIAEDLADIYQDIKDFLGNYRTGATELMNDALAELVSNFEIFWGQKTVNCLRALHNVFFGGDDLSEEGPKHDIDSEPGRNADDWIFSRRQREWQSDEDNSLLL